ncbi:DUF2799 domain-containing protein [bacterium]|nr:DUF2799 domain-containing protein [bacterium]
MHFGVISFGMGAAAVLLASCSSPPAMSVNECAAADWRAIGYQDGANGYSTARFGERDQICLNAGYRADAELYRIGREEGLFAYCDPRQGFRRGVDGGSYAGVCPAELDPPYRAAFEDGLRVYKVESALSSLRSEISSLRSERDECERKISQNETGLIQSQSDAERDRHRAELIRLRDERARIDGRLEGAEREERARSREASNLRAALAGRW